MKRLQKLFQNNKKDILSVYFTAGFPTLEDTVPTIEALQKHGVELIEVGIPFSDPMADGLVIQESSHKALQNRMNIHTLFSQLIDIRKTIDVPLIMMGYLNPIMQFGFENFCRECQRLGIDGMIIPDLPMSDYLNQYKPVVEKYELDFIFLITPETTEQRIREIDNNTSGFIYMVSSASVTGTQQSFSHQTNYFNRIKHMNLKNPCLIGFGVSNKVTKEAAFNYSAGAIVGSAFINALKETDNVEEGIKLLLKRLNE